jgi:streptomycin 6-kinase
LTRLPPGLDRWRTVPGGAGWLERLPRLAAECAERWSLRLGEPFEPARISLVVPAWLQDGTRAVLKLTFPEPDSEHEADALAHWDGRGAVRLLARDEELRALLVERCDPGTQLWQVEDDEEATAIAAGVARRLWRPAPERHRFRTLEGEATRWAVELPPLWEELGRPFEPALLSAAVTALEELGPTQGEPVVVDQDFHGGNVLRAEREPWLAIDPKPMVGEREFGLVSLVRDRRDALAADADPAGRIRRRLDLLSSELGLDRERLRGWSLAHALAWAFEDEGVHELHVDCARWLAQA